MKSIPHICVFYTNVNDTLPFVHGDSTYILQQLKSQLVWLVSSYCYYHCYCYGCGHYLQLDALFLGNLFAPNTSSICNTYCVRLICASKRRKTLLVTVAVVVVVFVVVFVDSRKLTICSVMELRRFHILQNLYNRHFGISRLFKFQFNSISRRLRILLLLLFCFLPFFSSALFHHLLHFFCEEEKHWKFPILFILHIPTKWFEQKIFKSSFDNFSFQSQLMVRCKSSSSFFLMVQFVLFHSSNLCVRYCIG